MVVAAAWASPAGGSGTAVRSFAEVLAENKEVPIKVPFRHKGMPAVRFSEEEVSASAEQHKFALVGSFVRGRPAMATLRQEFEKIGFADSLSLGLLDQRHILLKFGLEEDFQRCWLKQTWIIRGFRMRISRWTPDFRPDVESPIILVWVTFDGLPLHLHVK
ncbi:unnamed protein product, partial [Cuscuta europaea]